MWVRKLFVKALFLSLILLLTSFGCATMHTTKEPVTVTLLTDDQTKLTGTYYPALTSKAPGVILLPDTRCDRNHFADLPSKLNEAGFGVLAMDFRYKELIGRLRNISEQINTIQKQDLNALVDQDMKSAINFLSHQDGIDPERIGLIGTSLGSRVGLISGSKYKINALVLISLSGSEAFPGGKSIKQLLEEYGERPLLFVTSEKDWGGNGKAAQDNKFYFEWAKGKKELKIWPGSGHGVDILKREEASKFVLSWLGQNL
jgi:dienelactone hydrolase